MKLYYESEELMHYGVKGMKWGVRKRSSVAYRLNERARLDAKNIERLESKKKRSTF